MNVMGPSHTLYHGLSELVFGDRTLSVVNAVHPQQAACLCLRQWEKQERRLVTLVTFSTMAMMRCFGGS